MSLAAAGGAGGSVGPAIHKHYTSLQMQRNASEDAFYTREVVPEPQLSPSTSWNMAPELNTSVGITPRKTAAATVYPFRRLPSFS